MEEDETNKWRITSQFSISEPKSKAAGIGVRHLQSVLLALGTFTGYLMRVNMSIAIVAMTNIDPDDQNDVPVFDWRNTEKQAILSSFFIGYLIMNIPAGIIGSYLNKKWLLMMTFAVGSIVTIITPYLVIKTGSWEILIILRVLTGILQAFMLPTTHGIIAKWAPPNERSKLIGFILSGIPFGTMVTLANSGILASTSSGWPLIFYVTGTIGIIWSILWCVLGADNPSSHPFISESEILYIESSLCISHTKSQKRLKTPCKNIISSLPVWAIILAHTGHNWGFWLLLSEMPTFINSVLGFNIKADGLLSAIPYLSMWIAQFPVMYLADYFNKRQITTISSSRKIWNTIGMWGGATSLVALGYLDSNAEYAIILYIIAVMLGCCCNVGFNINHVDLSPNYAGIIMGITNCAASSGGFGAPLIVAYIVTDVESILQWRTVFFIGAGILAFTNLFFIIFGSGNVQPWNTKYADKLETNTTNVIFVTDMHQNTVNGKCENHSVIESERI